MKCEFIELTATDDSKILINVFYIGWVEANKNGSTITFNMIHYSLPKKVKESYEAVKLLLDTSKNS
jgi:hypothetical protein